jgi:hypothetical protein
MTAPAPHRSPRSGREAGTLSEHKLYLVVMLSVLFFIQFFVQRLDLLWPFILVLSIHDFHSPAILSTIRGEIGILVRPQSCPGEGTMKGSYLRKQRSSKAGFVSGGIRTCVTLI